MRTWRELVSRFRALVVGIEVVLYDAMFLAFTMYADTAFRPRWKSRS